MKKLVALASLTFPLTLAAQTPHEADIAWDPPANSPVAVASYQLYFDDDGFPTEASASVSVGLVNQVTLPLAGLPTAADDLYFVGVAACSAEGACSEIVSTEVNVQLEPVPPNPPQNVRVLEIRPLTSP